MSVSQPIHLRAQSSSPRLEPVVSGAHPILSCTGMDTPTLHLSSDGRYLIAAFETEGSIWRTDNGTLVEKISRKLAAFDADRDIAYFNQPIDGETTVCKLQGNALEYYRVEGSFFGFYSDRFVTSEGIFDAKTGKQVGRLISNDLEDELNLGGDVDYGSRLIPLKHDLVVVRPRVLGDLTPDEYANAWYSIFSLANGQRLGKFGPGGSFLGFSSLKGEIYTETTHDDSTTISIWQSPTGNLKTEHPISDVGELRSVVGYSPNENVCVMTNRVQSIFRSIDRASQRVNLEQSELLLCDSLGLLPSPVFQSMRSRNLWNKLTDGWNPDTQNVYTKVISPIRDIDKAKVICVRLGNRLHLSRIDNSRISRLGSIDCDDYTSINGMAVNPNVSMIATYARDSVCLWNLANNRKQIEFIVSIKSTQAVKVVGEQDKLVRATASSYGFLNKAVIWDMSSSTPTQEAVPSWRNTVNRNIVMARHLDNMAIFTIDKLDEGEIDQSPESLSFGARPVVPFCFPRSDLGVHGLSLGPILKTDGKATIAVSENRRIDFIDVSTGNLVWSAATPLPEGKSNFLEITTVVDSRSSFVLQAFQEDNKGVGVPIDGSYDPNLHQKSFLTFFDCNAREKGGRANVIDDVSSDGPIALSKSTLAAMSKSLELFTVDLTKGNSRRIIRQSIRNVSRLELSNDGSTVFTQIQDDGSLDVNEGTSIDVIDTANGKSLYKTKASIVCVTADFIVTSDARVYSRSDGKFQRTINLDVPLRSNDHRVTFTRDVTKAFVGYYDSGRVELYNTESAAMLASLYDFNDGLDWLVTTPDGYFDGSPGGIKLLSYRIFGTSELIPLERYRKQFEVSGLLTKIWKGEEFRKASALALDLPPTGRIISPKVADSISGNKLFITAEATSRGKLPVTKFRLMVNDKPAEFNEGIFELENPKTGTSTATWELKDLAPGKYSLTVLSYNDITFHRSEPIVVSVLGGGLIREELPTLHVFAVGISEYPNDRLEYGASDAEAVSKAFATHSKPLFKKVIVKTLLDEQATDVAIKDALADLRQSMTQNDFGIFYFAGHGHKDNRGKFYLMPINGNKDRLSSTAVDGGLVAEEIAGCPGQTLLILDACHSGSIIAKTRSGDRLAESLIKDLTSEEKSTAVMCSAFGNELAQESREHKHGMFTVGLLEALSGKAAEGLSINRSEGALYFKQIDSYVTLRVKQLSRGQQHAQTIYPREGFRDFPLTKP